MLNAVQNLRHQSVDQLGTGCKAVDAIEVTGAGMVHREPGFVALVPDPEFRAQTVVPVRRLDHLKGRQDQAVEQRQGLGPFGLELLLVGGVQIGVAGYGHGCPHKNSHSSKAPSSRR